MAAKSDKVDLYYSVFNQIADVLKRNTVKMDYMFDAYVGYDIGSLEPDDIPKTEDDVWILGKKYNSEQGKQDFWPIRQRNQAVFDDLIVDYVIKTKTFKRCRK